LPFGQLFLSKKERKKRETTADNRLVELNLVYMLKGERESLAVSFFVVLFFFFFS